MSNGDTNHALIGTEPLVDLGNAASFSLPIQTLSSSTTGKSWQVPAGTHQTRPCQPQATQGLQATALASIPNGPERHIHPSPRELWSHLNGVFLTDPHLHETPRHRAGWAALRRGHLEAPRCRQAPAGAPRSSPCPARPRGRHGSGGPGRTAGITGKCRRPFQRAVGITFAFPFPRPQQGAERRRARAEVSGPRPALRR